jgi:Sec-independent protein translocase protein TatA
MVVGPDKMPGLIHTVGQWVGHFQRIARDVRREIDIEFADQVSGQSGQGQSVRTANEGPDASTPVVPSAAVAASAGLVLSAAHGE